MEDKRKIKSINEWMQWAAYYYQCNRAESVRIAATVTGTTVKTVQNWLYGRREAPEMAINLLSSYSTHKTDSTANPFPWVDLRK